MRLLNGCLFSSLFFFLFSYLLLILGVNITINVCKVGLVVLPEVFLQMRVWLLILCIVIVSGCPGPRVNDGVKVSSFGFDFPTISDKEQVQLSCEIENVGAFDAEDVSFFMYGYDDAVWESVDEDVSMGTASGGEWTVDEFRGYDMDTKAQGMSAGYYNTFKVVEDTVSKGITQKYNFNGRLCYYYETRANAKFQAISAAERRDDASKGKYSGGGVDVWNSYGPIQIQVKTKSPLVFYESSDGREAELVLIIRNAAGGFPSSSGCSLDIDVSDTNRLVELEVSLDGAGLDCDETYSFYDGEAVVYCLYDVGESRPKGEYLLSIVAGYYYYVDVKTSVSVVGSSDDVEVGTGAGRDRDGEVYKGGSCEELCEDLGQYERFEGLAMCTEDVIATYPGTDVKVRLKVVSGGSVIEDDMIVYLGDLKLHDVKVEDINLRGLSVGTLNKPGISKQYTERTFWMDSDGDGLPDEWEDIVGLKDDERDSDGDGVNDGREDCRDCSGNNCDSERTYKWNFDNGCKETQYHDALSLGLEGSLRDARVTSSANGEVHRISNSETVDGMRIVGIGDKTIAEMTGESRNSRIQSITYIDVEKLDLKKMSVNFNNLFKKTECDNMDVYDEDNVCRCVVEVEGAGPDGEGYPPLESESASRCRSRCKNVMESKSGACVEGSISSGEGSMRCDGSMLVKYDWHAGDDDEDTNYGCDSLNCWCYSDVKSLSSLEKNLLCKD